MKMQNAKKIILRAKEECTCFAKGFFTYLSLAGLKIRI